MAVGSLTGSLLAASRTQVRHRLVVGAALAFGAVEIAAGLMPTYLTFALVTPLLGLTALTMITAANTFMQLHTDAGNARAGDGAVHDDLHGRDAAGCAVHRLGRRDVRGPLDAGPRRRR